ncbi:MAG: SH3 domain-containing protein [Novosphingobium sp.]
MPRRFPLLAPLALLALSAPLAAADRAVPYWASIRSSEVNMRVGPARDYRIAWVYRRQQLPLKVVRLKEGWRLVEDPAGTRGWMLAQFLSPERSALITGTGLAEMRAEGRSGAKLLWRIEPGVVGKLGDCDAGWCRLDAGGHAGFVPQERLWGAAEP